MNRISLSIFVLLLLALGTISTIGAHQTPGPTIVRTQQASPGRLPQLGFDCGLGSTQAVVNGTGFPVAPSETGTFQTSNQCNWIGDVGNHTGPADRTTEPLVADQDESLSLISTKIGGGFTANIVYLQNGTSSLNGFDITVSYDPSIVHAVMIDQTGLPWIANSLFTPTSKIDNSLGSARLAQVILGSTVGNNFTLFRVRFDVVGVGTTSLTFGNNMIVNPSLVVHQTVNGGFNSESVFDPTHTLLWSGGFTFSPNPPDPLSPLTFLSNIVCPGCTMPLHYQWDFNNDGITDSISNPATVSPPNSTFHISRVSLQISDSASFPHNVTLAQRLPFTAVIHSASTLPVNTPAAWIGAWIGGIANYVGSWRFCPGSTLQTTVCAKPTSTIVSTPIQNNTVTLGGTSPGYHFSGIYNVTLTLIDAGSGPIPPSTVSTFSLVNITGGSPAYTVAVTPQAAPAGTFSHISTSVTYAAGYPSTLRGSSFKYTVYFGDGSTAILTKAPATVLLNHTYALSGIYNIKVVAQDTLVGSQIQETGFATINVPQGAGFDYSLSINPSQGSVGVGNGTTSAIVIVNTVSGTPQQVTLSALSPATGINVVLNKTAGTPPFAAGMTITVAASTQHGTYNIPIIANTTTGIFRIVVYTLAVNTSTSTTPIIGVWSSQYSSSNITDLTLTKGSTFSVQVNVTNAPQFNGYEFVLYFDPTYLNVTSYDLKAGLFSNPFPLIQVNENGALRLSVVNLGGPMASGSGTLVSIVFAVVKAGGVSPLVLAAGTENPSGYSSPPDVYCSNCPGGTPNWTRIVSGSTALDVRTSDGYFKNSAAIGPVASFTYSPSSPQQGNPITFDASASFDPDNSNAQNRGIYQYIWDFGDKSASPNVTTYAPTVTHTFALSSYPNTAFTGNFSIRLIVVDLDNRFEGMKTLLITITPPTTRDLGVTIFPTNAQVFQFQNVTWTVNVANLGTVTETFNLTLTLGPQNLVFGRTMGQSIQAGQVHSFVFTLDTTHLAAGSYTVTATITDPFDTNPSNNVAVAQLQVLVPDELPTASFTFTPKSPVVGEDLVFNGTKSSDPDGAIQSYGWNFGDGFVVQTFSPFMDHTYNGPGNYTVTLTVFDTSGLRGVATLIVHVLPRPPHDVGLAFVQPFPQVAFSGQQVTLEAGIVNTGSNTSTVDLTFYYNGKVAVVQHGLVIPISPFTFYADVQWDTTGVSAGNYTISATVFLQGDPTPDDNSLTGGQLTLLPPPVITLTPSSGPTGTLVVVHGSGFPTNQRYYPVELEMTFDNQLIGFFFPQNSSFDFTFDVPVAQAGPHTVHALQLFPSTLDIKAVFTVTSSPGQISLGLSVGTVYFPGDNATIFITTTLNGQFTNAQTLQVILIRPGAANLTLSTTPISTGVYKAKYMIPSTGAVLGTYAIIVKAHIPGSVDSTGLASFEVKPTWLSSNGRNITTGVALTGLVGLVAFAWRKGYFRKKDEDPAPF